MGRWRRVRIWGRHAAIIAAALVRACLSGPLAFDRDQNGRDNSGVRLALVSPVEISISQAEGLISFGWRLPQVPLLPEFRASFRPTEEAT